MCLFESLNYNPGKLLNKKGGDENTCETPKTLECLVSRARALGGPWPTYAVCDTLTSWLPCAVGHRHAGYRKAQARHPEAHRGSGALPPPPSPPPSPPSLPSPPGPTPAATLFMPHLTPLRRCPSAYLPESLPLPSNSTRPPRCTAAVRPPAAAEIDHHPATHVRYHMNAACACRSP